MVRYVIYIIFNSIFEQHISWQSTQCSEFSVDQCNGSTDQQTSTAMFSVCFHTCINHWTAWDALCLSKVETATWEYYMREHLQSQLAALNGSMTLEKSVLHSEEEREGERCQCCLWCMALQFPSSPWAQWSVYWSTCVLSLPWNTHAARALRLRNALIYLSGPDWENCVFALIFFILSKYQSMIKQGPVRQILTLYTPGPVLSASQAENKSLTTHTHTENPSEQER